MRLLPPLERHSTCIVYFWLPTARAAATKHRPSSSVEVATPTHLPPDQPRRSAVAGSTDNARPFLQPGSAIEPLDIVDKFQEADRAGARPPESSWRGFTRLIFFILVSGGTIMTCMTWSVGGVPVYPPCHPPGTARRCNINSVRGRALSVDPAAAEPRDWSGGRSGLALPFPSQLPSPDRRPRYHRKQ